LLNLDPLLRKASRLASLPLLRRFQPPANTAPTDEVVAGFRDSQRLAQAAVKEVASHLREGWTETRAAGLLTTYLRDHGVKGFFHHSFAWFGERTRFDGIRSYAEYSPSKRVLLPGEVFILDVAPIYRGYISDIGYTRSLGENAELEKANHFLESLRRDIPKLAMGATLWKDIDDKVKKKGYENIHQKYPFSVLGHRVHRTSEAGSPFKWLNFGWQSYWELATRGVFGQLLGPHFEGDMTGLWAVEPHVGTKSFGAKFEEILLVTPEGAEWIDEKGW